MSAQDQLEIINSHGDVRFHDLNTGRGITNIGRHPDNDIVIESEAVAPFHAILDHQNRPFRLISLSADKTVKVSGQVLQPNVPRELRNWDTIELDGTSIILMEGGAATGQQAPSIVPTPLPTPAPTLPLPIMAPLPVASLPATESAIPDLESLGDMDELDRLLAMLPEDRADDIILVEPLAQNGAIDPAHPHALDFSVDVEQPATMQITVTNAGDLVGEFQLEVRGLDPTWVAITPASINLFEGQRGNFSIAITAPRMASSRAKAHYFSVVVSSPNYPARFSSTAGLLVIKPFYDYAVGDIDPKKQKISWSKKVGTAIIPIANLGNGPMPLQVSGEDDRHASTIEFDSPEEGIKLVNQLQVTVRPEETQAVKVFITPRKRRFIAFGGENINYTLTVTPLAGTEQTPRSVLAQANALPFMGPIPIILALILLALLALWIFTPRISDFRSDVSEIESGQSAALSWQTSFLSTARITPDVGKLDGPQGTISVSPLETTTYTLSAETWLTYLMPQWFKATRELTITVDPILPVIRVFEATKTQVNNGDDVTITWAVDRADALTLTINGAEETIPTDHFTGSRTFKVERSTIFELRAINVYTGPEGVVQSISVDAQNATSTPAPTPAPQQFDVQPQAITAGDAVTITWAVKGADKVTITGVDGELPPSGSVTVRPQVETSYVLTAYNGEAKYTSQQQTVIVNPAPTATPQPQAPQIDFFQASPVEVDIGSDAADNIELSWSINGDVTNVEITGPSSARFTGLPKKGSLRVATAQASLYVITAYNGSLRTSQTAQVKVKNPSPHINSISPTSSTDVGGNGVTLVVNGFGFVPGSKVQLAGSNRNTVYVSETQLTASVVAEDMVKAATFEVKVFNATPGGGTSNGVVFTINNPAPTLTSLSPGSITKGSDGFALTVTGTNFVNGSKVRWGGADAPTTYISSTQLTAQILASQLTNAGSPTVSVSNPSPGGGTSNNISFTINATNPLPTINSLIADEPGVTPATAKAGVDVLTVTINGTSFIPGSLARWKGTFLTTRYLSDTRLEADIPPEKLEAVGNANITVFNPEPGGGISNAVVFTVTGLSVSITPSTAVSVNVNTSTILTVSIDAVQVDPVTVSLTSSNAAQMTIHAVSGTSCVTSATVGSVSIPAGSLSANFCVLGRLSGTPTVTASLSPSLGTDTAVKTIQVTSLPPTITSLVVPADLASTTVPSGEVGVGVGSSSFELIINGTGFQPGAYIKWGTEAEALTTWVSNTQLKFNVPASFLDTVDTFQVSVRNASSSLSNTKAFNVESVSLTVSPFSPASAISGSGGFTLTVTGTNFVNGSVVLWNGTATGNQRPTTFVNSTTLTAQIFASDIQTGSSITVRVRNPPTSCLLFCQQDSDTFVITAPTLELLPSGSNSVAIGSTTTYTVNITDPSTQSGNRVINLSKSGGGASTISILDSGCTNTISSITLEPNPSAPGTPPASTGTFCVRGLAVTGTSATITAAFLDYPSSSDTSTITVTNAGTTVSVAKANPSGTPVTGQSITFTATVTSSGGTPTGNVNFTDSLGDTMCSNRPLSGGVATCTVAMHALGAASRTITASYLGTTGFNANSGNMSLTVNKASTTTSLVQSATTSVYGEPVTYIATIGITSPGSGTLGGTIQLLDSSTALSTVTVSSSVVNITPSSPLSVGSHSLTAAYLGDTNYEASSSLPALSHTVSQAATDTRLVQNLPSGTPVTGESVTLRAFVKASSPSVVDPTGTVTFKNGGSNISGCVTVSLNANGEADCLTTFAASSSPYSLSVDYAATTNFSASTGTLSGYTVAKANTTVTVTKVSPAGTPVTGETATLRATVTVDSPGSGTPTGTVTFTRGSTICSVALSSGVADCAVVFNASGSPYSITVAYSGSADYNTDSTIYSHTVNKADTTATVTKVSPAGTPVTGESATLRATVTADSPGSGTPTGTVTFRNGLTVICSAVTLSGSGTADCSATFSAASSPYSITATYNGDSNFNTDTSATYSHTVNKADTTVSTANIDVDVSGSCSSAANTACFRVTSVSVNSPGSGTPTGAVTFNVYAAASGGSPVATVSGTVGATYTSFITLTNATYYVAATYGGNTNFNASAESSPRVSFTP